MSNSDDTAEALLRKDKLNDLKVASVAAGEGDGTEIMVDPQL